jgi:hypothetical protein
MKQNQSNLVVQEDYGEVPGLVKKGAVAKAASCSLRTIDYLQARGMIPYIKLSPRYHLPSVMAALRRFEENAVN